MSPVTPPKKAVIDNRKSLDNLLRWQENEAKQARRLEWK
jgi:hypothetical protein